MTNISPTKLALVSTVSLGLLAGPIALAGPASAGEMPKRDDKCTVEAQLLGGGSQLDPLQQSVACRPRARTPDRSPVPE